MPAASSVIEGHVNMVVDYIPSQLAKCLYTYGTSTVTLSVQGNFHSLFVDFAFISSSGAGSKRRA